MCRTPDTPFIQSVGATEAATHNSSKLLSAMAIAIAASK
jgi:hypothetical protein